MKTIAVISQKGGAGKTTLTLHLAVAAQLDGKSTVVIDLDPQASAASWNDSRAFEDPAVITAPASRLKNVLSKAEELGADLCWIDTAPHSERDALAAARAADYVIIPCRPSIFDIRAIGNTVEMARLAKVPAVVIMNAVKPSSGFGNARTRDAVSAIKTYDIEVAPTHIVERVAFEDAITAGQGILEFNPKCKAASELSALYSWISKNVSL